MDSASGLNGVDKSAACVAGLVGMKGVRWSGMLKLVSDKYPYCTMHGVHVVDGCIVACEGIQISFVFGGSGVSKTTPTPLFDSHWEALKKLCAKIGSGRLAEVRFSQGRPVAAKMNEGGRRFRRLMTKPNAIEDRSSMS